MTTTTVKAPPIGTGSVVSAAASVSDFISGLGTLGSSIAESYAKIKLYGANIKNSTSAETPIAASNDDRKLVSESAASGVSSNQLLMVGGGILAGGLLLYVLLKKK